MEFVEKSEHIFVDVGWIQQQTFQRQSRDANIWRDQIGAGGPGGGSLLVGFRGKPWLGGSGGLCPPEADENLQITCLNLHVKCILIIVNLSQTEHVNANLETYNEKIYNTHSHPTLSQCCKLPTWLFEWQGWSCVPASLCYPCTLCD